MKGYLSILFVLIAIVMIGIGVWTVFDQNTYEKRMLRAFGVEGDSEHEQKLLIGYILLVGGIIFFVLGMVFNRTAWKRQKQKERQI
ncbi:MAG: hypothetical protein WCF67_07535 [Chitinophagaceae bacterium]